MTYEKIYSIREIDYEDGYTMGLFVRGQLVKKGYSREDLIPYVHGFILNPMARNTFCV